MLFHRLYSGVLLGVALLAATPAGAQSPGPVPHTVFLVGGAGVGRDTTLRATLTQLSRQTGGAGTPSTLVLLGDNLSNGLPMDRQAGRAAAQARLTPVLDLLQAYPGRVVVVPGGEDWQRGGRQGWQRVQQQEKYVEAYLGRGNVFVPDRGCPGPVELALDAHHTLIVLDTQWWLHAWDKPGETSDCEAKDPAAVVTQLEDMLDRNEGRHVLVVGHHPLLRPNRSLWQELLPNPRYKLLQRALLEMLRRHPGLTYASGHERRLAYEESGAVHHLVSGAGATAANARAGRAPGWLRLHYAADDSVHLSGWQPGTGQPVLTRHWVAPRVAAARSPRPDTSRPAPLPVRVQASAQYRAGRFRTWLQGANYRREWQQFLTVPVLDLGRAQGGLTPLKRGGGFQTKSLRLRAADGREFVLRTVDKTTDASVPDFLRHTFAADIVQDQISAAHPYAALVVPTLAEAAGVGHSNPKLVLVPDDDRLGPYRREFAGALAFLEAREPSPPASFNGQPLPKRYSTPDVLAALEADHRHRVDQRAVLRARLLDLVLADWDRHDDQWRWVAYPQANGGLLFRALPRDRDQAFFVNQGVLPRLASADYLLPKLQGFDRSYRNVNTFNFQARHFDRSFLTGLSRADWQGLADSVQTSLSDAVLTAALRQWPDSIYQLSGPTVLAKLQAHRAQLPAWAGQYYAFLAREVDVPGSQGRELFAVERQAGSSTLVTVYALSAAGQRGAVLYRRTFPAAETREVRLYGQGGDDVFDVRGQSETAPLVRVVGGAGADSLADISRVRNGRRKTRAYDEPGGLTLRQGPETATQLRASPDLNRYSRTAFQYGYALPLYRVGYNVDDGIFVGLGRQLKRPGFHKAPWAATHTLTGDVALRTGAFNFQYQGHFTRLIGGFDLHLQGVVQAPNYIRNFYGLGNESVNEAERDFRYYRVRFRNYAASAVLRRAVGPRLHVEGGPVYQHVQVEAQADRVLGQLRDERLRPQTLFAAKQYGGATLGVEVQSPDAKALFGQGIWWHTQLLALRPLTTTARPLTYLTSELALYRSFRLPVPLTLAGRVGGAANFSGYEFFQAATLGGLSNLRGYRRTRFAGRQSLYQNLEARVQLGRFSTYLLPATFGVVGFHDVGRVWQPGESSQRWHRGYGGGLWLSPTPRVVVTTLLGFSAEGRLPLVRLGHFF